MKSVVETCINVRFQTIFTLEKVKEITNQAPETRHEEWFQETYGDLISEALLKLTTPEDPTNPGNCWTAFKQVLLGLKHRHLFLHSSKKNNKVPFTHCVLFQLHRGLQERASRRTSLLLQIDQISSKLSNLRSTTIAMPGISSQNKVVTIEGVSNHVQILPTKTKPKKLVFLGSDGKR